MKKFRFLALLLPAVFTMNSLAAQEMESRIKALEGVTEVKAQPAGEFKEKYEVMLRQPLDWGNPEAGEFEQRVVVMHTGADRPTMLITQGYGAGFALRERYREEISRMFDMNMVFVEHRYFDRSMPENPNWDYLTAENSAHDLHAIKSLFSKLYPSKWVASGISKGGTTTMLYATFYPEDVDVYVPYVGPVCTGREDGRFNPFLKRVSTPEKRAVVEAFQREVLKRKEALMPRFEAFCNEQGLKFRIPLREVYDYCVLEYAFSFWQWGSDVASIPATTASDETLVEHLIKSVGPDYFAIGGANSSFFVQAAKELGYYPYDLRPFKGLIELKSSKDYLRKIFIPEELREVEFDKALYKKMRKYLRQNDPKMLLIYGEDDPWTAPGAGWAAKGKQQMHYFVDPAGSHRSRIMTLPDEQKYRAMALLYKWLFLED